MSHPTQPHRFRLGLLLSVAAFTLAAAFLTMGMRGQTGSSTPTAAPATPPAVSNAPRQQTPPALTTLRTRSNLVVIDVVVTDSKKNAIHGLHKSDFSLLENGKPQAIRNFEEHSASSEPVAVIPPPKLPEGLFSNKPPAPSSGPVNVLLLDYLNTPMSSQPNARKQLNEYLDKAPAGTRIAIFGMTTQLNMLQGFTSDISVLKAALASKKGAAQASQILSDSFNGGTQGGTTLSSSMGDPTASDGFTTQEMVDGINRIEAMQTSFQLELRAKYTFGAFDQLAMYLVGIPGRKNVIWFSGGFPLDVEPNVKEADPNDSVVRNDEELRKTANLLTRAQIALYPVDVRGLQTDPSKNFANQNERAIDGNSGANAADDAMAFMQQTAQEHQTMMNLAEDTGGEAFINTNGLTQAVSKAIEEGANYYTLTYSPSNAEWDSRFRSIKVKVDNPNAKLLSYRNGYYADNPDSRNKLVAGVAATALASPTTMVTAMLHGGPDPAEILFKVRIRPANTPPDNEVLPSNQANPDPHVKVNGPFKEYGVDLVPDPRAVNCPESAGGNRHCSLEIWTFVYNRDGVKLVTASNRLHRLLTPQDYNKLLTGGMAFHQQISVPVKGDYFLRTAIHDLNSDKVGAVEVAVAQVKRLDPLKTIAETSPAAPLSPDSKGASNSAAPNALTPVTVPATAKPADAPTGARPTP